MASHSGRLSSARTSTTEMHPTEPLHVMVCPVVSACLPSGMLWPNLYQMAYQHARVIVARRRWARQWEPSAN